MTSFIVASQQENNRNCQCPGVIYWLQDHKSSLMFTEIINQEWGRKDPDSDGTRLKSWGSS